MIPSLPQLNRLTRTLVTIGFVASFGAGCSSLDMKKNVVEEAKVLKKGPAQAPSRAITNFSSALRCMDGMFAGFGVRDVSVMVEDLHDTTKKVNAGTKDMLISAVSDMTRRSRAIRLIAYGNDSGNIIGFLHNAQRRNVFAVVPPFDIKGSITQWDENLVKNQADAGVSFSDKFSFGAAKSASASTLAIDLTVLSTADLSVIPGITSRNSVVITKEGNGADGDAKIQKFGDRKSVV